MLELRIASFAENPQIIEEGCGIWKFILAQQKDLISLYAGAVCNKHYKHKNIVQENGVPESQIRGGGMITCTPSKVRIYDKSLKYGIVPNAVMQEFVDPIADIFKEFFPIRTVEINMAYELKRMQEIMMWRELGYNCTKQRIILNL
ncbi:hypothetical protein KY332_05195 [Candidatus Woesearchaeota archaeon]|nr:hypothetical protein [Candidatus Woesearchaeota archaeon]